MIAGRHVLACQHNVTPELRGSRHASGFAAGAGAALAPVPRACARHRCRHVEPQRVALAVLYPPPPLGRRQPPPVTGIERHAVGIVRPRRLPIALGHEPRDLPAAFEAWVDETHPLEPGKRGAVIVEMLALAAHRLLPAQPQPGEILIDRLLVLRPAARTIDILDPQQQPPVRLRAPARN